MDIHGIDLVFEGQMYVGPPGSGAPAHWHGAALNVMAYGKKRWCAHNKGLCCHGVGRRDDVRIVLFVWWS